VITNNLNSYKDKIDIVKKYTENSSILLVEDYIPLHKSLLKFFSSIYKEVDSAYDGEEALELYKYKRENSQKYEIIFTDIEMPKKNGIELVKEIRKINITENIIIFSAYQDSKYLLELINNGVRKFIPKPIEFMQLLDELILIYEEINEIDSGNKIELSQNVVYDKKQKNIYVDEELVKLSQYEQLILYLLIDKINKAVSNTEIVNYLELNMIDVNLENVRKLVYKLRNKLPKEIIQSVYGIGYRIIKQK